MVARARESVKPGSVERLCAVEILCGPAMRGGEPTWMRAAWRDHLSPPPAQSPVPVDEAAGCAATEAGIGLDLAEIWDEDYPIRHEHTNQNTRGRLRPYGDLTREGLPRLARL